MSYLKLDHLAVSGESRDAARAHIETALGVAMQTGGAHARFSTHNYLMGLDDGLYLEAISIDPSAPTPDRPRWFDLDNFSGAPRLTNWICSVKDIDAACRDWPDAGQPVPLERGDLKWQMAVPETGKLPFDGMFPPLIQWSGALHPAAMLEQKGVALKMLTLSHPKADELAQMLGLIAGAQVRFETADESQMSAEFNTPHGVRVLS